MKFEYFFFGFYLIVLIFSIIIFKKFGKRFLLYINSELEAYDGAEEFIIVFLAAITLFFYTLASVVILINLK